MQRMSETSASADLAGDMKDFTDAVDAANTEYEESEQLIERNAIKADLLKQELEELAPQVSTSADAARNYATVVDLLNEIYPELNLQIDEQTGLLTANSKAQLVNIDAMKQKALYAAKEKRYSAILEAQAEATLDLYEAKPTSQQLQMNLNRCKPSCKTSLDILPRNSIIWLMYL